LFQVTRSGPGASHVRSFWATSDMLSMCEIAITDRLNVSTVASYLLSCFTSTCTAMNSDSYNLFRPDATFFYILDWSYHCCDVVSWYACAVIWLNGPRHIMSLSIFCILCDYYIHV